MPFFSLPDVPAAVRFQESHEGWVTGSRLNSGFLSRGATRHLVTEFRVGDVTYELRNPVEALFDPPIADKMGRFFVWAILPEQFAGRGNDIESARLDWEYKIDDAIQSLLAIQDFERNEAQKKDWTVLSRNFNLEEIRFATPSDVRVRGTVEKVRGFVRHIRWLDGSVTKFRRDQIPASMVGFKPGQQFDAVLTRDSRTWSPLCIKAAFKAVTLAQVTDSEAERILSRIPSVQRRNQLDY